MQRVAPSPAGTEGAGALAGSNGGGRLPWRKRAREVPGRSACNGAQAPGRQRGAGSIRQRCARVAERIRNSAGVHQREGGTDRAALKERPWPRLVLWVFACAALVVTLMVRADGLDDRDPGSTIRTATAERSWATRFPVLSAFIRRGEAGALSPRSGPES